MLGQSVSRSAQLDPIELPQLLQREAQHYEAQQEEERGKLEHHRARASASPHRGRGADFQWLFDGFLKVFPGFSELRIVSSWLFIAFQGVSKAFKACFRAFVLPGPV